MFNPDLYLRAYGQIYKNYGATTKGITDETVDGMSLKKIRNIIEEIRYERFRWTPVRRTHIPKASGKMRPLGIPTWTDKLVQEVMRSLLEAYYEPQFSKNSHGFRPNRGCHTALMRVKRWVGTVWFVEGDIEGCFDNIDHEILLSIIKEDIHDNRFLRLMSNMLKAGYMEDWKKKPTLSGTPQGGIISPLLANIYLDKLDKFVESQVIPEYTKGKGRKSNPKYNQYDWQETKSWREGKIAEAKEYRRKKQNMPSGMTNDPNFRRCLYVRYADDFLLGFIGPKSEAMEIKEKIKEFLLTIKLKLSEEKTLITNATMSKAQFLGYEIRKLSNNTKRSKDNKRIVNGKIGLFVPMEKLKKRCKLYMNGSRPGALLGRTHDSDFDIIFQFGSEYRGFVQYYKLAQNLYTLKKLRWFMETSLLKTLAHKHKTKVGKMRDKYASKLDTPEGPRTCLKIEIQREGKSPATATFAGISLKRKEKAKIEDLPDGLRKQSNQKEIIQRLLANECELCGSHQNIQIHHIRKLSDLNKPGRKKKPKWKREMIAKRRKTLVVCRSCHVKIHAGKPTPNTD